MTDCKLCIQGEFRGFTTTDSADFEKKQNKTKQNKKKPIIIKK